MSMFRFTNLTDLNLTKNEINYIEDGAFAGQANLQVCIFRSFLLDTEGKECQQNVWSNRFLVFIF